MGYWGEGGDDDPAAATVSTVTAELWSCSHGQCSEGVGVGGQAQCDNELSWGREGQNSFWTWPGLIKKLNLGRGAFNSKIISFRGKLITEVKNKQSDITLSSGQSLLLPGRAGSVHSSTW